VWLYDSRAKVCACLGIVSYNLCLSLVRLELRDSWFMMSIVIRRRFGFNVIVGLKIRHEICPRIAIAASVPSFKGENYFTYLFGIFGDVEIFTMKSSCKERLMNFCTVVR